MEGPSYKFNECTFDINAPMSCTTKNLIYVITCTGCGEFYIGQTGTTLRDRVRVHKQQIKEPKYRQIGVSEHLDICGKTNFTIFPFYKVFSDSKTVREERETYFQNRFKPSLNKL